MGNIWTDMFVLTVPVLEKVLRTVIVYVLLIFGLRVSGKRELAQLNPFDLVVLLLISNTVQNAIIGDDNTLVGGIIGAATLFLVNAMIARLSFHIPAFDRFIEGTSSMLMNHGQIQQRALAKELITERDLLIAARKQGFDTLDEVDKAELEPDGDITFTRRDKAGDAAKEDAILARLDQVLQELAALKAARSGTLS